MRRYFIQFFLICFLLTLIVGVVSAVLPTSISGILTAVPYLVAMVAVLYSFLKREQRAPDSSEQKRFSLGFGLIFWGYNVVGVLVGVYLFSRDDPAVIQNFKLYISQPQFMLSALIMFLMIAIPLYLITYWFYGKQAKRMAAKKFH